MRRRATRIHPDRGDGGARDFRARHGDAVRHVLAHAALEGIAERRAEVTRVGRAAVGRMADEIGSAFYPQSLPGAAIFRMLKAGRKRCRSIRWCSRRSRRGLRASRAAARISGCSRISSRAIGAGSAASAGPAAATARREGGAHRTRAPNRGGVDLLADDADDFFAAFGPTHPPALGTSPQRLLRREATHDRAARARRGPRPRVFLDDVASLSFASSTARDWRRDCGTRRKRTRRLPRAVRDRPRALRQAGEIHHFTTAVDMPLCDRHRRRRPRAQRRRDTNRTPAARRLRGPDRDARPAPRDESGIALLVVLLDDHAAHDRGRRVHRLGAGGDASCVQRAERAPGDLSRALRHQRRGGAGRASTA